MRIMALDIGEKRIGVAVSDPGERVASPIAVLPAAEVLQNAPSFRRLLEDWEPELLVCGLPMTLAGEEGPQAQRIREQALDQRGLARAEKAGDNINFRHCFRLVQIVF